MEGEIDYVGIITTLKLTCFGNLVLVSVEIFNIDQYTVRYQLNSAFNQIIGDINKIDGERYTLSDQPLAPPSDWKIHETNLKEYLDSIIPLRKIQRKILE